jgi:hypothetical protein
MHSIPKVLHRASAGSREEHGRPRSGGLGRVIVVVCHRRDMVIGV